MDGASQTTNIETAYTGRIQRSITFACLSTMLYFVFVITFIFRPTFLGAFSGDTLSLGVVTFPAMIVSLLLLSYSYIHITDRVDEQLSGRVRS